MKKATLFYMGGLGMGYRKVEVRNVEITTGRYAQYPNAVFVEFTKKGGRKRLRLTLDRAPRCVILEGWDHPDLSNVWNVDTSGQMIVKHSRHHSFSDEWTTEFKEELGNYLAANPSVKVAADYHSHDAYKG